MFFLNVLPIISHMCLNLPILDSFVGLCFPSLPQILRLSSLGLSTLSQSSVKDTSNFSLILSIRHWENDCLLNWYLPSISFYIIYLLSNALWLVNGFKLVHCMLNMTIYKTTFINSSICDDIEVGLFFHNLFPRVSHPCPKMIK